MAESMFNTLFDKLEEHDLASVLTEPGRDCGDCYPRVCRPAVVDLGTVYVPEIDAANDCQAHLLVYPCGRVELVADGENHCLYAGKLVAAERHDCSEFG